MYVHVSLLQYKKSLTWSVVFVGITFEDGVVTSVPFSLSLPVSDVGSDVGFDVDVGFPLVSFSPPFVPFSLFVLSPVVDFSPLLGVAFPVPASSVFPSLLLSVLLADGLLASLFWCACVHVCVCVCV